ncbi:ran-specific GTPase-activating protein-like, partial [Uloborus diversus]|uniref:ran-specific GTPase-activating protein-like n=1 Tax=Uloborus diversus TaxID=327109 RepID=UPI0024094076
GDVPSSPEIHFEPIVKLPLVEVKTLEENEETLFQMRAKLFRYDSSTEPPEWKERGTGDVKILKHKSDDYVRILMRREKTLKICANHYILPQMELKPNSTSDRAWVWSTLSDFADEEPKPELLAIKFANAENAQKFKEAFNAAKELAACKSIFSVRQKQDDSDFSSSDEHEGNSSVEDGKSNEENTNVNEKDSEEVAEKLSNLNVKENSEESQNKSNNSEVSIDKTQKD